MTNEIRTMEERKNNLLELGKKKGYITYEELANELKGLDDYLDSVEKADLSHLSSEFRRINQALTQTKRDMGDLNKTMKNNFFDDLYDSIFCKAILSHFFILLLISLNDKFSFKYSFASDKKVFCSTGSVSNSGKIDEI